MEPVLPTSSESNWRAATHTAVTERRLGARILGVVLVVLSALSLLAPSRATKYYLLVLLPLLLACIKEGLSKPEPALAPATTLADDPGADPASLPAPTHPLVLGWYSVMGLLVAFLSFSTWLETDAASFSGLDRGGGWYTLVFGLVLCVIAVGLGWDQLRRPLDVALHVLALGCGTVFIAASVAGTFSAGLSTVRWVVLAIGLATATVAAVVLRSRATTPQLRRGHSCVVFANAGLLMMAAPFMSWGGGFLVNYRPGTTIGGFDGRVTMFAGAAIVALSIWYYFYDRASLEYWSRFVAGIAALGFTGLAAVINAASGEAQPGRALAAAACLTVMVYAANPADDAAADSSLAASPPRSSQRFASRSFVAVASLLGAFFVAVAYAYGFGLGFLGQGPEFVEFDDLTASVVFAAFGWAVLRSALGAARGRALSAQLIAVPLIGLTLALVVQPSDWSAPLLVTAIFFVGLAALGLSASSWTESAASRHIAGRLVTAIRQHWLQALVATVAGYVALRWVLPEILPSSPFDSEDPTRTREEVRQAIMRRMGRRTTLAFAVVALVATNRKSSVRDSLVSVVVGAALAYLFVAELLPALPTPDSEAGQRAIFSLPLLAPIWFAVGRGRFSVAALALAVSTAGVAVLGDVLLFRTHQSLPFTLPGELRNVLLSLSTYGAYFGLAVALLAYPAQWPWSKRPDGEIGLSATRSETPPEDHLEHPQTAS